MMQIFGSKQDGRPMAARRVPHERIGIACYTCCRRLVCDTA
jgi:hypothetical protein